MLVELLRYEHSLGVILRLPLPFFGRLIEPLFFSFDLFFEDGFEGSILTGSRDRYDSFRWSGSSSFGWVDYYGWWSTVLGLLSFQC